MSLVTASSTVSGCRIIYSHAVIWSLLIVECSMMGDLGVAFTLRTLSEIGIALKVFSVDCLQ